MGNRYYLKWRKFLKTTPRRKLAVYVLVFLIAISGISLLFFQIFQADQNVTDTTNKWYSHGPGMGGYVPKVTVDQVSSNIVYAGSDVSGIFKSTDSGQSWFTINNGLTHLSSTGVTIDYDDHNILYTTTDMGTYKSVDAGSLWVLLSPEIKISKWRAYDETTNSIVQSKSNPDVFYAIGWAGDFYADFYGEKFWIYKSTNHGETWSKDGMDQSALQPFTASANGNRLFSIVIDPNDENKVYVGSNLGVFYTKNSGASWQKVSALDTRINIQLGYNEPAHTLDYNNTTTGVSVLVGMCMVKETAYPDSMRSITSSDNLSPAEKNCITENDPNTTASISHDKGPRANEVKSVVFNPYNSKQMFALSSWGHVFVTNNLGDPDESWDEIYHRDMPLKSPGHLRDTDRNSLSYFAWSNVDWYSKDTYQPNSIGQNFHTIKIDANPECQTNSAKCADYYIYVSAMDGVSRGKVIWRLHHSENQAENNRNFHLDSYPIDPPTPDPCVTQYNFPPNSPYVSFNDRCKILAKDRTSWEVVFNYDKTGGNLNRNDWTFGKAWNGFSGTSTFDLDQSSYPAQKFYAVGVWGAARGVASDKFKDNIAPSTEDGVTYTYNTEWDWSWKGLDNTVTYAVAYDPLDPKYIYATLADQGFIRSTDGGKTFERSLDGVTISNPDWGVTGQNTFFGGHGWALATTVKNGVTNIYAGLTKWGYGGGTLFKSTDHAAHWTNASGDNAIQDGKISNALPPQIPGGGSINNIAVDSNNPDRLFLTLTNIYSNHEACYAAFEACRNTNQCKTNMYSDDQITAWKTQICDSPRNRSIWNANPNVDVNISEPVWTTSDGGTTWHPVTETGLSTTSWGTVAYEPKTNHLLYGNFEGRCGPGAIDCNSYGIFSLDLNDTNATWMKLDLNLPSNQKIGGRVLDIKADLFKSGVVLVVTMGWGDNHVPIAYVSRFDFSSLALINGKLTGTGTKVYNFPYIADGTTTTGIANAKITFDQYREGRVMVNPFGSDNGSLSGPLFSTDKGLTWEEERNLPALTTSSTAFHPLNPDKILLGMGGNGLAWSYNVTQYTLGAPIINKTNLPSQIDFSKQKELDLTGTAPANSDISIVFEKKTVSQNQNFFAQIESSIIGHALADSNKQTFSAKTDANGNWSSKIDLTKLSLGQWGFYAFASLYDDVSADTNTITIALANGSSDTNLNVSGNNNSSSVSDNSSLKNNSNNSAISGGKPLYKTGPENFWIAVGLSVVAGLFIVL